MMFPWYSELFSKVEKHCQYENLRGIVSSEVGGGGGRKFSVREKGKYKELQS